MAVTLFRAGELPPKGTLRPGDLLLVHGNYPISKFIRLCTGSYWNHVAVVLDEEGNITEALGRGIVRGDVAEWKHSVFAVVSPPELTDEQRIEIVEHALWVVGEGWEYGKATFVGMLVFWATRGKCMVSGGAKVAICSGHAADCYHAGGVKFPKKIPYFYTPEDIGERFGVEEPAHG